MVYWILDWIIMDYMLDYGLEDGLWIGLDYYGLLDMRLPNLIIIIIEVL